MDERWKQVNTGNKVKTEDEWTLRDYGTTILILLVSILVLYFVLRPAFYILIQTFRFMIYSWAALQDLCYGGKNWDTLNPFYQLSQFPYSHYTYG